MEWFETSEQGSVLSFIQIKYYDYVDWINFQLLCYGMDQSLVERVRTQRDLTPRIRQRGVRSR